MALQRGMAFSGSGSSVQWENSRVTPNIYDVFINHQGEVKEKLVRPLHKSLEEKGIRVFLDSAALKTGDHFPAALEQAINSSVVQIAIFSKQYCGSHWCLDELVLMLQTKAMIIPVFYDVEPSDLRYIQGKTEGAEKETGGQKKPRVYDEAFAKHETRYSDEKVKRWKEALDHVSKIQGKELRKHNDDNSLLEKIVSEVVKEVEGWRITKLETPKHPVGLNDLVEGFERSRSRNREEKVEIVGIYGNPGSGKTTLAKELYNLKKSEYDGSCFLHDVADGAAKDELPSYQSRLLFDLVRVGSLKFCDTDVGKLHLKNVLERSTLSRFLLVLDNVSNQKQLDALLIPDALSSASLAIVSTRDEGVLIQANIENRYELKEMSRPNNVELFCWSAFGRPSPPIEFQHWVDRFVNFCGDLQSLQETGTLLSGRDDECYWEQMWDKVQKYLPEGLEKIQLIISYDMLDREDQQIFIDTACFFSGRPSWMALKIWKGCEWKAEAALGKLKGKCLVQEVCLDWYPNEFDDKLSLRMHDHIRDFGRQLAKELKDPRRLWLPEHHTAQTFRDILSTTKDQCFRSFHSISDSSLGYLITYFIGNLRDTSETVLLWLELDLNDCENPSLPEWIWIYLKKLQCLRISFSQLKKLWNNSTEAPIELTELLLEESSLAELLLEESSSAECTSILGYLKYLEKLILIGKKEKRPIEGKILSKCLNKVTKLRILVLRSFALNGELALKSNEQWTNLESGRMASENIVESTSLGSGMRSLETMEVRRIEQVSKVSISGEHCPILKYLCLDSMDDLIEVYLTLETLNFLELRGCKKLERLFSDFDLAKLVILTVVECGELQELPSLACLSCVESITIDGCKQLQSVSGIEQLQRLKYLHLSALPEGTVRNCIDGLQTLPTEFISVIGNANLEARMAIHGNNFPSCIGVDENAEEGIRTLADPHKSFSAVIICTVVLAGCAEESHMIGIPRASDVMESKVGAGYWIVTVLVTGEEKLKYELLPRLTKDITIKKRWTLKLGAEDEALRLLRRIIHKFYTADRVDKCNW